MSPRIHPVLTLRDVARSYREGEHRLDVFKDLSLAVAAGEIVALVGPSGAGKSSLLHIAGLLEPPTSGEVFIAGQNCSTLDDGARTRIRRVGIGFVYQFHHLLPEFSALENVMMPQFIAGAAKATAATRARELLTRLGLAERLDHRPAELSGGERQRVAIARAIANRPLLLLADEPTGNLDARTADTIQAELMRLIAEEGLGALIATHNMELARRMTRIVRLEAGRLIDESIPKLEPRHRGTAAI
jgi:lipoprotein-releasing system ATP-binding protein